MKIIEDKFENILVKDELSIALGTFDGVHRGHQEIIETAVSEAKRRGIKSAVFTFNKHPFEVLKPDARINLLTDNFTKSEIIKNLGVDYLFFIEFNREFAGIEPAEFLNLLRSRLNARVLVCGFNYTFGRFGRGGLNQLMESQDKFGYDLRVIDKISFYGRDISSSIIRDKIELGDIEEANQLLGHKYSYIGEVIKGKQLGRLLGFPTANIAIPDNLCINNGIYVTLAYVDGISYPSVSNIGYSPTFNQSKRLIETHIFNYNGDLYGKVIRVEFLHFIRRELKFSSIDELKNQVFCDMDVARSYFSSTDIYNL